MNLIIVYRIATAGCLALAMTGPALAQDVVSRPDGLVSIDVEHAPLGRVLRDLSALGSFSKFAVGANADNRQVTVHLQDVPLPVAVVEVLKAADVAYVFSGGRDPVVPFRLVADVVEIAAAGAMPEAPRAASHDAALANREPEDETDAAARTVAARGAVAQTQQAATVLGQALTTPGAAVQTLGSVALPFATTGTAPVLQVVTPAALHALPFPTAAAPAPGAGTSAGLASRGPQDAPLPDPAGDPMFRAFTQAVAPPPSVPVR